MAVLMWVSNPENLPSLYSKVNLGVACFDCILFWLWGHSFVSIFNWIIFGFEVIRVAIAFLLYRGVIERALMKCKIFCLAEFALLCFAFLFMIFDFSSIAHIIWTLIVIAIRGYGIWIIGGFIRILQSEQGESASFPWIYFPEPVQVQDKSNVSPGHQIPPV
ncbi:uncharacterized protein LOC119075767 [Bradysia coprophila]|uniref:uncharacterized protein LOC119075767 n=1 Tax=Bradysia coprophila TaxID=38358 RepID=UPI00187DC35B|nr:uncharacterized protein LOC119075767 [Bradysia coprophila]